MVVLCSEPSSLGLYQFKTRALGWGRHHNFEQQNAAFSLSSWHSGNWKLVKKKKKSKSSHVTEQQPPPYRTPDFCVPAASLREVAQRTCHWQHKGFKSGMSNRPWCCSFTTFCWMLEWFSTGGATVPPYFSWLIHKPDRWIQYCYW